jgi:hypothetical protein
VALLGHGRTDRRRKNAADALVHWIELKANFISACGLKGSGFCPNLKLRVNLSVALIGVANPD